MTHQNTPLPSIEAPALTKGKGVRHAFFTREGGVSGGLYQSLNCGFGSDDDRTNVAENRRRICGAFDLPASALITGYQVHGTSVATVDDTWLPEEAPKVDGLVTRKPGITLGILTADCAPVLFADADIGVIGACHAGWRGALDGIIDATVAAMESLGAERSRISASIGPCITQDSYQVGADFRDRFLAADTTNDRYFKPDDEGRYRFDLPGYVQGRLKLSNIADSGWVGLDTCSEDQRFFSYRRSTHKGEADFGRGLSAIVLADR